MKNFRVEKKLMPVLGVLGLSVLTVQNAQAGSTFSASALVNYTIDSIVNTTGTPGDLSGLNVTGGFSLDSGSSYIDIPVGSDGFATPFTSLGDEFVDPVIGSYAKTLSVNGSVNNGTADASYLGFFNLSFANTSTNVFDIQVTLNYDLNAAANGQNATNTIQLDFFNEAEDFNSGITGYSVLAATASDLTGSLQDAAIYSFTLGASASDALYVDVGMSAYLEASPVPAPAAFWLFGSALMVPAFRKYQLV